jgi:hypothetical protein
VPRRENEAVARQLDRGNRLQARIVRLIKHRDPREAHRVRDLSRSLKLEIFTARTPRERKGNPDNEKERFITFDNRIADTRDENGFCTLQDFPVYFLLFFALFASLR